MSSELHGSERAVLLEVDGVSKTYKSGADVVRAIGNISFGLGENEFVSVVGPSGCGKTTLLQCLSGLLASSAGEVRLRGSRITETPREMAIVFQDYSRSLFPWLSIGENVRLPIRKGRSKRDMTRMVDEALEAVSLSKFERHYPYQLSGGMQQRAAIARALAYSPRILLLDEPFASVDAQTRTELEDLVLRIGRQFDITCLLVTHDVDESVYMADRVVILTHQPSVVLEELTINLPWPRDQIETKRLPEFAELRARVYRGITQAHAERRPAGDPLAASR